jgi:hypothetical protein
MAMNWSRVRSEDLSRRHGWEPMESIPPTPPKWHAPGSGRDIRL